MCGIVGEIGDSASSLNVLQGLKRLEYRGYDSAGIAAVNGGRISRVRAEGKLSNLEQKLKEQVLSGSAFIGHTRWATHGKPTEQNAHPHVTERLALVHNGVIENARELRLELEQEGIVFESETDTEVAAQLISLEIANTPPDRFARHPERAIYHALQKLRGAFAFLVIFDGHDDLMVAARRGSPVAIGHGKGKMYVGSDALALAPFTNRIQYLLDGDIAVVRRGGVEIFDDENGDSLIPRSSAREILTIDVSEMQVDQGGYSHFMLKEIYEQPDVVGRTLARYIDFSSGNITLPKGFEDLDFKGIDKVNILACGTSYYAGLVAKYWLEEYAGIHTDVEIASEFRYRKQPLPSRDFSIVVSQSGETADTKEAMLLVQRHGQKTMAVVNVESSSIAREADLMLPIKAGTEIGVASTKAFTCQLAAFAVFAIAAGKARGTLDEAKAQAFIESLGRVPGILGQIYKLEEDLVGVADKIFSAKHALYLGRGTSFPLAMEGALKLKEISYIHAEGYAAGEMKHGPIALIDADMPVVVIAPHDEWFEKTVSNMQEAAARDGKIVLITDEVGVAALGQVPNVIATLILPQMPGIVGPFAYAMVLQLLAYHTAVRLGCEIDQPRNLAKSVTVE